MYSLMHLILTCLLSQMAILYSEAFWRCTNVKQISQIYARILQLTCTNVKQISQIHDWILQLTFVILSLSLTHTHTHARTHAHTHTHTHTCNLHFSFRRPVFCIDCRFSWVFPAEFLSAYVQAINQIYQP